MTDLTEKTIRSEQLLEGKLLNVFRDEVRLPDGETSQREWIDHPGASAVIPIFEDGSTILIRQFRYPPRRSFLELPAGKFDNSSESAREVALRELEEETGWRASSIYPIGSLYPCIGYSNEIIHYFIAEDLSEGRQDLEDAEFVEVIRMPLSDAVDMAECGELVDMKTFSGLMLAKAALARGRRENGTK